MLWLLRAFSPCALSFATLPLGVPGYGGAHSHRFPPRLHGLLSLLILATVAYGGVALFLFYFFGLKIIFSDICACLLFSLSLFLFLFAIVADADGEDAYAMRLDL